MKIAIILAGFALASQVAVGADSVSYQCLATHASSDPAAPHAYWGDVGAFQELAAESAMQICKTFNSASAKSCAIDHCVEVTGEGSY